MAIFFLTISLCVMPSGACKTLHVDSTYWSEGDCQTAGEEFVTDHFDEMRRLGYKIEGFTCLRKNES